MAAKTLRRAQRRHSRFVNSAMMATLMGALRSDQLEDGRVVSGVGGQYNFIAQALELEDARAIIEVKATRNSGGRAQSNIRWSYGAQTVPRHLRDMIVTEYGLADLRGLPDRDCIVAMLNLADSRFQAGLLAAARRRARSKRATRCRRASAKTARRIEALLEPAFETGLLVEYPLGTQMTPVEMELARALGQLRDIAPAWSKVAGLVTAHRPFQGASEDERAALARMGLGEPSGLKERGLAILVKAALRATRRRTRSPGAIYRCT